MNAVDPARVLSAVLVGWPIEGSRVAAVNGPMAREIAARLVETVRANTEQGAGLRAALGVQTRADILREAAKTLRRLNGDNPAEADDVDLSEYKSWEGTEYAATVLEAFAAGDGEAPVPERTTPGARPATMRCPTWSQQVRHSRNPHPLDVT